MCAACDEIEKANTGKKPMGKTRKGTPHRFVLEYEREFRGAFADALSGIQTDLVKRVGAMTKK